MSVTRAGTAALRTSYPELPLRLPADPRVSPRPSPPLIRIDSPRNGVFIFLYVHRLTLVVWSLLETLITSQSELAYCASLFLSLSLTRSLSVLLSFSIPLAR